MSAPDPPDFAAVVADTLRAAVHAMRNPVAAVTTGLQLLHRDDLGPDDRAALDAAIASGLARLDGMLAQLDDLARRTAAPRERFCFDARCEALARAHDATFHPPPEALWVHGDADGLMEALDTLLGRCAAAGAASLRVDADRDGVLCVLGGDGRVEGRGLRVEVGGARGVELAMARARWVIAAHGGTVTAGQAPGESLRVRLPRA
jgi:two-component system sensor histidine kinase HydH